MKGTCSWIGSGFFCREEFEEQEHAAVAAGLWEEEGLPFFSPCIYSPYKCAGVFKGCSTLSLFLIKLSQNWFSPFPRSLKSKPLWSP